MGRGSTATGASFLSALFFPILFSVIFGLRAVERLFSQVKKVGEGWLLRALFLLLVFTLPLAAFALVWGGGGSRFSASFSAGFSASHSVVTVIGWVLLFPLSV